MTAIPALEIGVWNAWILMLALFLSEAVSPAFVNLMCGGALAERMKRTPSYVPFDKTERRVLLLNKVILVLLFAYSVFLPLQSGTGWLYAGLAMFSVGVIIATMTSMAWATTPLNEPVTRGPHHYSRHPMYASLFLRFLGVGIASASWLFILLSILSMVLMHILALPEERFCFENYGDVYRHYMDKTPRWVGISKSKGKS